MSVQSLLRPYDIDLPQNPMVEVPSSGWELLKAQAEAFRLGNLINSEAFAAKEARTSLDIDNKYFQLTGQKLLDYYRANGYSWEDTFKNHIEPLRRKDPARFEGFPTYEDFEFRKNQATSYARNRAGKAVQHTTTDYPTLFSMLGAMSTMPLDPAVMGSMLIPQFGASIPARVGAAAAAGAGAELPIQIKVYDWQTRNRAWEKELYPWAKELGNDYSIMEAVFAVTAAGAFGALAQGLVVEPLAHFLKVDRAAGQLSPTAAAVVRRGITNAVNTASQPFSPPPPPTPPAGGAAPTPTPPPPPTPPAGGAAPTPTPTPPTAGPMTFPQRVMKYAKMPTEEIDEKLKATYELWAEMTKNKADVRALNAVRDETEAMVEVLRARKVEGSGPVEPTEPLPPQVQAEPSPPQPVTPKGEANQSGEHAIYMPGDGGRILAQWELVSIDDLVTSDMKGVYPQHLQPRNRSVAESEQQIRSILDDFKPQWLLANDMSDRGAPIIAATGTVVESGNGRVMALRRLSEEQWEHYRQTVQQFLGDDVVVEPGQVLVSRRTTKLDDIELMEFTRLSNRDIKLAYNPSESARDLQLSDDALSLYQGGYIGSAKNRRFVLAVLREVDPNLHPLYLEDRVLHSQGMKRIERALMERAYGDTPMGVRVMQDMDVASIGGHYRSLLTMLRDVASDLAKFSAFLRSSGNEQFSITTDLLRVVRDIREAGPKFNLEESLAQTGLLGDDAIYQTLMELVGSNLKKTATVTNSLKAYMDEVQNSLMTNEMFGRPLPEEILAHAKRVETDAARVRGEDAEGSVIGASVGEPEPVPISRAATVTPGPAEGSQSIDHEALMAEVMAFLKEGKMLPQSRALREVHPKFFTDLANAVAISDKPAERRAYDAMLQQLYDKSPKRDLSKVDPSPNADPKINHKELVEDLPGGEAVSKALDDVDAEVSAIDTCAPK